MKKYTLIYWQDGKWLVGRLRERSDVFSQGMTLRELETNIQEALNLMGRNRLRKFAAGFQGQGNDY